MQHEAIFAFIGNSIYCFLAGYCVGLTFYAIRQFINRASRP
jgi:hypothetical protein